MSVTSGSRSTALHGELGSQCGQISTSLLVVLSVDFSHVLTREIVEGEEEVVDDAIASGRVPALVVVMLSYRWAARSR